jgi:hypothetical protein
MWLVISVTRDLNDDMTRWKCQLLSPRAEGDMRVTLIDLSRMQLMSLLRISVWSKPLIGERVLQQLDGAVRFGSIRACSAASVHCDDEEGIEDRFWILFDDADVLDVAASEARRLIHAASLSSSFVRDQRFTRHSYVVQAVDLGKLKVAKRFYLVEVERQDGDPPRIVCHCGAHPCIPGEIVRLAFMDGGDPSRMISSNTIRCDRNFTLENPVVRSGWDGGRVFMIPQTRTALDPRVKFLVKFVVHSPFHGRWAIVQGVWGVHSIKFLTSIVC